MTRSGPYPTYPRSQGIPHTGEEDRPVVLRGLGAHLPGPCPTSPRSEGIPHTGEQDRPVVLRGLGALGQLCYITDVSGPKVTAPAQRVVQECCNLAEGLDGSLSVHGNQG